MSNKDVHDMTVAEFRAEANAAGRTPGDFYRHSALSASSKTVATSSSSTLAMRRRA